MMTAPPITTTPQNLASKVFSSATPTMAPTASAILPVARERLPRHDAEHGAAGPAIADSTLTIRSVVARSIE